MDASRFDRLTRQLSRRGFAALIGGGLLSGAVPEAAAKGRPKDVCGGQPTKYSKYCAGIRTCETDDDCAVDCACIERRTGCCYAERRKRGKPKKRRCVDLRAAFLCTSQAGTP
jgi:hypothetical protein